MAARAAGADAVARAGAGERIGILGESRGAVGEVLRTCRGAVSDRPGDGMVAAANLHSESGADSVRRGVVVVLLPAGVEVLPAGEARTVNYPAVATSSSCSRQALTSDSPCTAAAICATSSSARAAGAPLNFAR